MNEQPVVVLEGVTKDFGKTRALDAVSLEVHTGEIVVLLGLSGSGKSTLLRHLDGLEQPTEGSITVLGEHVPSLRGKNLRALRRKIGFIFQQFELVGSLTVLENVLTGALGGLKGPRLGLPTYPRALRDKAFDHLEEVGFGEQAFQRADTLSGGQQQRVAIARALMQDPEILLADEPVASLDPESSRQVMNLIREIAMTRNLTVICTLHQVDLALDWGDHIVGLRHGKLVLNTGTEGLSKEQVMAIYGRVATDTEDLTALARELSSEIAAAGELAGSVG